MIGAAGSTHSKSEVVFPLGGSSPPQVKTAAPAEQAELKVEKLSPSPLIGKRTGIVLAKKPIAPTCNLVVAEVAEEAGQNASNGPDPAPESSQLTKNEEHRIGFFEQTLGGLLIIEHYIHSIEVCRIGAV